MKTIPPLILLGACLAPCSFAELSLAQDFQGEGTRLGTGCGGKFSFSLIANCGELLFTDHPLHIAIGSLAPQNGFGAGAALVGHWTTTRWRNSWDVDAVAAPSGSWRAGGYLTFVRSGGPASGSDVVVNRGRPQPGNNPAIDIMQEMPVFHLYSETDSLNKLLFFGLGPSSTVAGKAYFGLRETVSGGNLVWPVFQKSKALQPLHANILLEANSRYVQTRSSTGQSSPSIEQLYDPSVVLTSGAFGQTGEAIRLGPQLAGGHVQLNYLVNYQQYFSPGSKNSFQRFTADLSHQFPIYQNYQPPATRSFNGPDECSTSAQDSDHKCPPLIPSSASRNLTGSFGLRFFLSESFLPAGNTEPFYFQPTLGGSDINGSPVLASYQDYRFRAPNVMFFRASFEHSIYKWPVGFTAMVDEGKAVLQRSDIDFSHLSHSYSAGLTLRAGGFPLVYLLFSWGGHEGTHTTVSANSSLLGGGARPSLF